jgi:hypothetical protein
MKAPTDPSAGTTEDGARDNVGHGSVHGIAGRREAQHAEGRPLRPRAVLSLLTPV